jgi:putative flippase GtrA
MTYNVRIRKFLIVGISAAAMNFMVISIFIEILGFRTYFLKNLANILAIEICALYNFLVSRVWTWKDSPKRQGKSLVAQFLSFNMALLTGIALRIVLFPILERWGVFYLLNVTLGIGMAASIDFVLYDQFVFRRSENRRGLHDKSPKYPECGPA